MVNYVLISKSRDHMYTNPQQDEDVCKYRMDVIWAFK